MEDDAVPVVDPIEAEDPIEEDYEEDDKINVDRDLTGDGGLKKKILVRGTGWQRPETGDQVEVHYVGTLMDGTKFDSSRDRPEPFSFKLGVGSVIKGWDKGVATMKKGEKAILTCRGDYAYGEQGSPPKIPPNATLQFEVELLSWKNSKDISPDDSGGIIKTIVAEGKDWANPGERDEVLVHYKAYVEGSDEPFASSAEGGQEFTVRDGHLVPALPVALQTMKKGEKASLLVLPPFGLGEAGQPPAVPANATLKIELELVSWKKVEDVTNDGKVVKKTLQEGKETWKRPNEGATVTVRYTGRLPDGTAFDEQEAKSFCLEDGEIVSALELAVAKMHKGERAVVTAEPSYAYGEAGHAGPLAAVPPNTPVTWEVELTDLQNSKEMWEMKDDDEKLATSLAAKDKGNVAFKAGQNERAIKMYKRAIKFVEVDKTKTVSAELKGAFRDARKSAFLNLAAAQLKLGEFKEAIGTCEKVLEVDSGNIKALYRLAQAHLSNGDYIESELAIKRGLQLEERNTDLLVLSKKLKAAAREHNQRESKMFAKMFAPSKASASPAEPGTEAANGASAPASPAPAEAAPEAGAVVDPADLESTADKPDDPTAEAEAAAAQQ